MLKLLLGAFLGITLYLTGQEILDYQESKRWLQCTYVEHKNEFEFCSSQSSWLYKNYPDRPHLYTCLWPGREDRPVCKLFNIERMN